MALYYILCTFSRFSTPKEDVKGYKSAKGGDILPKILLTLTPRSAIIILPREEGSFFVPFFSCVMAKSPQDPSDEGGTQPIKFGNLRG